MASSPLTVQRLWSLGGAICLLVEREAAPRYEICVLRGEEVLKQDRLYARASAQMLAESWRTSIVNHLSSVLTPPPAARTFSRQSV